MASNEQQQNSALTFAEIMAMAERPTTPVGSHIVVSRTSPRGVHDVNSVMNEIMLLQNPSIPPLPKSIGLDIVRDMLAPAKDRRLVVPIGALPRDILDKRKASKTNKAIANFTTNAMTFVNVGKDGEFWTIAKQFKPTHYKLEQVQEWRDAMEYSTNFIGSSGSLEGLLFRVNLGLTEAPSVSLDVKECVLLARRVLKYHDVTEDFVGKSVGDMLASYGTDFRFNKNSSAGAPYYDKITDPIVMKSVFETATSLLNAIAEGTFAKMVNNRPSLMAVLLKNKQDFYDLRTMGKKIRPYNIYGGHERMLYSILQFKLKPILFHEDQDSASAVGFSWNWGGGDRLYTWICNKIDKGPGFYPLFYGDDQLWVIVLTTGESYIVTPDFSHMDLSLSRDWGLVAYGVWKDSYKSIDKTWLRTLQLNCKRAFTRQVVIDSALCYQFQHGLGSGIPGTTKFDEVASAAVNGYIQAYFAENVNKINSKVGLASFLESVRGKVKSKFGLIFKEGSLDTYYFEKDQPEYQFEFLGQTLQRIQGRLRAHYVPKPSLKKMMISCTTYKKQYKDGNLRMRATAQKMRSLFAMGGYLYPIFRDRCHAHFDSLVKRGCPPLTEDDEEYFDETEQSIFADNIFPPGDKTFPTAEWSMNLYLPPDDAVPEFDRLSISDRISEGGSGLDEGLDFGVEDFDMFDEPDIRPSISKASGAALEQALNVVDWGFDRDRPTTASGATLDIGTATEFLRPRVDEKGMDKIPPLPQELKDQFDRDQKDKRAREKAQRELMYGVTKGSRKGKSPKQPRAEEYEPPEEQEEYEPSLGWDDPVSLGGETYDYEEEEGYGVGKDGQEYYARGHEGESERGYGHEDL